MRRAPVHYGWWIVGAALAIEFFGLGYGGLMPLVPLTVIAYFGRGAMGAVLGCFKLFYDAAAALAPLATAYLYDRLGSYTLAFALKAVFPCVSLLLLAVAVGAPRPRAAVGPSR